MTYLKRFAALVTDFARKYRSDVFIRTEVNVIGLLVMYSALVLGASIGSLIFLYHNIVGNIAAAIATMLTASTTVSSTDVIEQLELVRSRQVAGIIVTVFAIATIFGYLLARFALQPARNALATQKQFIGNIAHELRTPLSIIKANTEIRLSDDGIAPAVRTLHKSNLEELDRISHTIDNLLSLSSLVRPERIPFKNVDVVALAEQIVKKLDQLVSRKQLKLWVLAGGQRYAYGNASALEQVMVNIIKNAIQYTEKGEITIMIGEDLRGYLEISVRDTGIGIKQNDLLHIFEPFYRGDRARTRSGGAGSGLGLTIASELIRLNNGHIRIHSMPGKGTNVIVSLPIGTADNKTSH